MWLGLKVSLTQIIFVPELSDGNTVHLNTNSVIEISYSADERMVDLISGEVLFNLRKDKSRP